MIRTAFENQKAAAVQNPNMKSLMRWEGQGGRQLQRARREVAATPAGMAVLGGETEEMW